MRQSFVAAYPAPETWSQYAKPFHESRSDCSEAEQTVLRAFATGKGASVLTVEFQAAIQSLIRKEILERAKTGYRLAVELFGRWIVKNQVAEALPQQYEER